MEQVRGLFRLAVPQRKRIGLALGALTASSAVNLAIPAGIGKTLDSLPQLTELASTQPHVLVAGTGSALAVFAAGAGANYARIRLLVAAGQEVVASLRTQVYASLLRREVAFYDDPGNGSGEMVTRLSADTALIGSIVVDNIPSAVRNTLLGLGGMGMMVYLSPVLAATTLGFVPPLAVGAVAYGRVVKNLQKDVQNALATSSGVAEEGISNVRTIKLFAQEDAENIKYVAHVRNVVDLAIKQGKASALFYSGLGLAGNITVMGVLGVGASQVAADAMSLGDLTSFLMYTLYVGVSVAGIFRVYGEIMKGIGASSRVFQLRASSPDASSPDASSPEGGIKVVDALASVEEDTAEKVGTRTGGVGLAFEDVSFRYPTRVDVPVLDGLSFELAPGSKTALIGASGSGKSSIVSLATGLYAPDAGRITIDGKDVREIPSDELRGEIIGVVAQDPVLFSGSIRDNIRYARPDALPGDVVAAARAAHADDFITAFPDGYDTVVGQRGITLSGGQRQRVAIARTLLTDPSLLVLDEASSALDAQAESIIRDAIRESTVGRTSLIITHRMASLDPDVNVLVLAEGRIVEEGVLEDLVSNPTSELYATAVSGSVSGSSP